MGRMVPTLALLELDDRVDNSTALPHPKDLCMDLSDTLKCSDDACACY